MRGSVQVRPADLAVEEPRIAFEIRRFDGELLFRLRQIGIDRMATALSDLRP
jgi:hypothetical protein